MQTCPYKPQTHNSPQACSGTHFRQSWLYSEEFTIIFFKLWFPVKKEFFKRVPLWTGLVSQMGYKYFAKTIVHQILHKQ